MSRGSKYIDLNLFKKISLNLKFTKLINQYYKNNRISGIAIGLTQYDNIIYENYFGFSQINPKVTLNEKTLLPWNSISHLLTTFLIMTLNNKQEIDLNQDLRKYLQDVSIADNKLIFHDNTNFPGTIYNQKLNKSNYGIYDKKIINEKKKIHIGENSFKIKYILSHRLGIDFRINMNNEKINNKIKFPLFDKQLKIKNPDHFKDNIPLVYENNVFVNSPGTKTFFSNSNYLLLGKLISDRSKIPFMERAREELKNIGLNHNFRDNSFDSVGANYGSKVTIDSSSNSDNDYSSNNLNISNLYSPYTKSHVFYMKNNPLEELTEYSSSILLPSYGIVSNLKDLMNFTIAFLSSKKILNDEQKRLFWESTGNDDQIGYFSNGFMIFNSSEKIKESSNKLFSVGFIGGFLNNEKQIVKYYPHLGVGLTILTNDESANLSDLVKDIEGIIINL